MTGPVLIVKTHYGAPGRGKTCMNFFISLNFASWQYQMQIPKLVPEIAFPQSLGIGDFEMFSPGKGFEHRQVCSERLVQASQHGVDSVHAALWCDDQARPALTRMGRSFFFGDGFQCPHHRCSYSYNPLVCCTCCIDQACCLRGYPIELLIWRLVFLKTGYSCMQEQRRDLHAMSYQFRDQLGREGAAG